MTEMAFEEAATAIEAIDVEALIESVLPVMPVVEVPVTPKVPRVK
jgi:hypothetical protein